jgi:ligand-binding sensor domain-containing protein/signal transduction histidine kinase
MLSAIGIAKAVDGTRAVIQYVRQQWGGEQGLNGGRVTAIAQTPDGYLWVGTYDNLYRFDGMRFESIQPPPPISPVTRVLSLTTDLDGSLWIRTEDERLLRYAGGHFASMLPSSYIGLGVTVATPARNGGLLAEGLLEGVIHITPSGRTKIPSPTTSLIISLAQSPDGRLWVGTREDGLITLKDGVTTALTQGLPDKKINCLLAVANNRLWIGTDNGFALWDGHRVQAIALPPDMNHLQVLAMVEDRNSNLWVGTSRGLLRYNTAGAQWVPRAPGHRPSAVTALAEDREGDIWFGDAQSLERLRDSPLVTFGDPDASAGDEYGPVYADSRGRIWVALLEGGLYWMRDGVMHPVTLAGLDQDVVYSIDGDGDDIWLGRQRGGLTVLHTTSDPFTAQTWTHADGLAQDNVYVVRVARDHTIWAGTLTAGVSHLSNGQIANFNSTSGLIANAVTAIDEDNTGRLWFGTPDGVSSLQHGRWRSFTDRSGLPSTGVASLLSSNTGGMWIGTNSGLSFIDNDRVRSFDLPAIAKSPVLGMGIDHEGLLWLATDKQILSIPADVLLHDPAPPTPRLYARQDGLRSTEGVRRARSVVADPLGRVWITTNRGIAATSLYPNQNISALAHVQSVLSDGEPLDLSSAVRIPSGARRITFNYTALDLRAPERIRFRYMLEGFDRNWSDVVDTRQAVYTNLQPGAYRFHVLATNSEGQWSAAPSTLPLSVQPLPWQRWEFQLGFSLALLAIVLWIYHARMQHVIAQANMRFEERLIERTRIARELHDTLLQGFQGLILYFQTATLRISPQDPARPMLEEALRYSDRVMVEGRDRVRNLRTTMTEPAQLAAALSSLGEELSKIYTGEFDIAVEGEARDLHPILQEEVLQIAREALTNAFRHSSATIVHAFVRFTPDALCIIVRDDGTGIAPEILRTGSRYGHWGLPGMRERAKKIRAHLSIRGNAPTGTTVEITVPASLIYRSQNTPSLLRWLRRLLPAKGHPQL